MSAYICRMCGGTLELNNKSVCRCEYCGNMQSVPQIDDEDKAELCIVAERFRKEYHYDKAIEIYERLLKIYPTDADLYWSMLLCRYGVEYREQGCTLNRTQSRSLLADEDYKTALKYASSEQCDIMERQAAEIDRVRRSIVEAASACKQYDIYLCCKDSDENGRRTKDAVLTAELYKKLIAEGFKVFFTQITLEDTLTSEWEQHIYAALNSSKVMVTVGTTKDSFENIWVKNAWVRYLSLMNDGSKSIIPAFRGIDASELPSELSHFQALDMSKLGFESDLISSIRAIVSARSPVQSTAATAKSDPLLRRAYVHLEDGEFSEAEDICDQLLKAQGESSEIYLVKLLVEYRARTESELDTLDADYSYSENYRRAMQLGDEGFRIKLREHNDRSVYNKLVSQLEYAASEAECRTAAEGFRTLGGYADSADKVKAAEDKAKLLKEKAEHKRREDIYALCVKNLNESTDLNILRSVELSLKELGDYKDSAELAEKCAERINRISSEKAFSTDTADEVPFNTKRIKSVILAASICLVAVAAVIIAVVFSNSKDDIIAEPSDNTVSSVVSTETVSTEIVLPSEEEKKYEAALVLLENGEYDEAITAFGLLGEYSDSAEKVLEAKYQKADKLLVDGNYDDAELIFTVLGTYSDSAEQVKECKNARGSAFLESGELDMAESVFLETQNFAKLNEVRYKKAELALANGDKDRAKELFKNLGSYSDSHQNYCRLAYEEVEQLVNNGSYEEARLILLSISDYPDELQLLKLCNYHKAKQYADSNDYENAIKLYEELGLYADSAIQLYNTKYMLALDLKADGRLEDSLKILEELGNSSSIAELRKEIEMDILRDIRYTDTFEFGSYEQDGDTLNGNEAISWIVLSKHNNELIAISEYVLDAKQFADSPGKTWEFSHLREWLNHDFYIAAFSPEEQAMLTEKLFEYTIIDNGTIYSGNYKEKISLLLGPELPYYDKKTQPTNYAAKKLGTTSYVTWWCIDYPNGAGYFDEKGEANTTALVSDIHGVRPVIVISLE